MPTYPPEANAAPTNPDVSVIIPVHNTRRYLPQCLNSAAFQTLPNVEIICVDDFSTDDSYDYLEERAALDKRIKVFHADVNLGAGHARNIGIDHANGRYLYFLDSDDFIEPTILEHAVALADKENSDVVPFKAVRFHTAKRTKKEEKAAFRKENFPHEGTFSAEEMSDRLFNSFLTWAHNKLFSASFIKDKGIRFQEIFRTNDLLFTYTALSSAERITPLDEVGINYRVGQSDNSQSTNYRHPFDFCKAFLALRAFLEKEGRLQMFDQSLKNSFAGGALYNVNSIGDPTVQANLRACLIEELFPKFGIDRMGEEDFYRPANYAGYQEQLKLYEESKSSQPA